mmetsp:Transcript_5787/g.21887  ORF Transcript_5787/g.21887 Transcript_5787/m.21887 type:complete len:422 (+) Transcript_5787:9056-10321(+)
MSSTVSLSAAISPTRSASSTFASTNAPTCASSALLSSKRCSSESSSDTRFCTSASCNRLCSVTARSNKRFASETSRVRSASAATALVAASRACDALSLVSKTRCVSTAVSCDRFNRKTALSAFATHAVEARSSALVCTSFASVSLSASRKRFVSSACLLSASRVASIAATRDASRASLASRLVRCTSLSRTARNSRRHFISPAASAAATTTASGFAFANGDANASTPLRDLTYSLEGDDHCGWFIWRWLFLDGDFFGDLPELTLVIAAAAIALATAKDSSSAAGEEGDVAQSKSLSAPVEEDLRGDRGGRLCVDDRALPAFRESLAPKFHEDEDPIDFRRDGDLPKSLRLDSRDGANSSISSKPAKRFPLWTEVSSLALSPPFEMRASFPLASSKQKRPCSICSFAWASWADDDCSNKSFS